MSPTAEGIARAQVAQYARACGPTYLDADDLHAIARLAAWQAEQTHAPEQAALETHLYTRTRYAVLDALRQHHQWGRWGRDVPLPVSFSDLEEEPAAEPPTEGRDLARVEAAVDALPEPLRTVVRLRYWHSATNDEIAARFGHTKRWVRHQIDKAAATLRAALEEA